MKLNGAIAIVLVMTIPSLCTGCSWIGMSTVPEGYHPSQELECSGCTAPVIDGVVSGTMLVGAFALIALVSGFSSGTPCEHDGTFCVDFSGIDNAFQTAGAGISAGMILVGAVYLVSAITGASRAGECKKARVLREAWLEMDPEQRKLEIIQHCEPFLSGQNQGLGPRRTTSLPIECEDLHNKRMAYWRTVNLKDKDENGGTPLHRAAAWGYIEAVQTLIDRGAQVNSEDNLGLTPLYWAIIRGRVEIVEILAKGGAEINTQLPSGVTPCYLAFVHGRKEIAEYLIAAGADVDARLESGETLLHWSAKNGLTDAAELLVENGAKTDIKDKTGWTPLMHAEHNGRRETIEYLKKVSGGVR